MPLARSTISCRTLTSVRKKSLTLTLSLRHAQPVHRCLIPIACACVCVCVCHACCVFADGFNDLVLDSTVNNQSLSECCEAPLLPSTHLSLSCCGSTRASRRWPLSSPVVRLLTVSRDLLRCSVCPRAVSYPQYNITLKDEIAATYKLMRETTSAGMLAFYQHNLLAKFKDAHTFASTSAMPKATFPIGVEPVFVDGEMKFQYDNGKRFVSTPFMEANPEFIKTVQTAPPGVSVYITAVNGQPPLQYFKKVCANSAYRLANSR